MRTLVPSLVLLSLIPATVRGQAPAGAEFQVNMYTTSNQNTDAVAMDASGNFVVVWQSRGQEGPAYGVFGRRFSATGVGQGSEFRVNTYTTGYQVYPAVASDPNGNFVVVWTHSVDGGNYGVFGQRFNALGAPQGSEFRVNSYTTNRQFNPAVASDANGNFVVVLTSYLQDGGMYGAFGRRFS